MSANVKINGTLLSEMGVSLLSPAYSVLLTPAPSKNWIENDDPNKNGVDVDELYIPPLNARDVTLTFLIYGKSEADYLAKYRAFIALLQGGIINLTMPDLGACYRLKYKSSSQFENYRLNACKLAVNFRENDPTNREIIE